MAFDWRGFGRSEWPQEGYWFPDYLGDLDALLAELINAAPARLVWATAHGREYRLLVREGSGRNRRVRCVVNMEGFRLARTVSLRKRPQECANGWTS